MASSYGAMERALGGAARSGAGEAAPERRAWLLALGAVLCLCAAAATHGYVSHAGLREAVLQEPQMLSPVPRSPRPKSSRASCRSRSALISRGLRWLAWLPWPSWQNQPPPKE